MVYQHILELIRHGIPCAFHLLTGFYCPGCGGTRAVVYLLQGQIGRSFQYHPLIPYMAAELGAVPAAEAARAAYKAL